MSTDKKVIIASDSSCDLGPELCERYSVVLNPFAVIMGDNSYHDGIDITPDDLYEFHRTTGKLARTSAINVAEQSEFFSELSAGGNSVIFFCISSSMSGTFNSAKIAAEDFPDVYVVDSRNLSTGVGLQVIKAAEMAEEGYDAKTIYEEVVEMAPFVNASFIIDSLEYLHKGGRCSALAALGANLLKLKPCIEVKNGAMGVGKKFRGRFEDVLLEYVKLRLADADNILLDRIFITHAGCEPEVIESVYSLVKQLLPFKEILVTRAGATVSVHCGKNTLGILYVQNTPVE